MYLFLVLCTEGHGASPWSNLEFLVMDHMVGLCGWWSQTSQGRGS